MNVIRLSYVWIYTIIFELSLVGAFLNLFTLKIKVEIRPTWEC